MDKCHVQFLSSKGNEHFPKSCWENAEQLHWLRTRWTSELQARLFKSSLTLHWTLIKLYSVHLHFSSNLWISKWNAKIMLIWKSEEIIPWSSDVCGSRWVKAKNAAAVVYVLDMSMCGGSWSTDSSCRPHFVSQSQLLNIFCYSSLGELIFSLK